MKVYLSIAFLLLIAGLSNGVHETLNHHYTTSRLPQLGETGYQFWNPDVSWENKYKAWPIDQGPAFLFSKTAFVFLTDAYHLTKFLYQGCLRAVAVILWVSIVGQSLHWARWKYWLWGVAAWLLLAMVQAIGFHLTYTIILPL